MDLSKVQIGDKVYSCLKGWGEVTRKTNKVFTVDFQKIIQGNYYFDGKYFESDIKAEITNWRKKRREWQPENYPDGYTIWADGDIVSIGSNKKRTNEGRVYATKKQAEYAYKSIRACQILNAYKAEFAPDWRPDWNNPEQRKWYVYYDAKLKEWDVRYWLCQQIPGIVCFPKEIAEQLCKDLNDEVVKL